MLAESDGDQIECVAGYMAYDLEDSDGLPIWILGIPYHTILISSYHEIVKYNLWWQWIGDLFFHQYYMIFDRGDTTTSTARIGFATAT